MEERALARAEFQIRLCTGCNVTIGALGSAMAIPALAYNWPVMTAVRLTRVGLVTTGLALLLVGGLLSAHALRHRPPGAARGLWFAGVAALTLAVPAAIGFFWEVWRSVRLSELDLFSSRVWGPGLVMVVAGFLAAANLIVVGIHARALPAFEPEAPPPAGDATSSSE
ncbi:MAG: hypothetical protein ACYTGX_01810 [Planctomycetota bacterium]|jgi:hypothetical protein